jgi:hypothetical protein
VIGAQTTRRRPRDHCLAQAECPLLGAVPSRLDDHKGRIAVVRGPLDMTQMRSGGGADLLGKLFPPRLFDYRPAIGFDEVAVREDHTREIPQ